ncbi:MAG: helix-turn-helix transcriptional regulator [Chloroflexota bacterium]
MEQAWGADAGRELLKKLRDRKGWSQSKLAIETGVITQSNYSHIESGQTHPSPEKLHAILLALDATKEEYEDAFKFFGYLPAVPLPEPSEVEAAIKSAEPTLFKTTFPAFLVDVATRLCHWNRLYERLAGREGREILETMRDRSFVQMSFESKQALSELIEDIDSVLIDDLLMTHRRLDTFKQEAWVSDFINEIAYDTPGFEEYWERMLKHRERAAPESLSVEQPMPIKFDVPDMDKPLSFIGLAKALPADDRFQVNFLMPTDPFTGDTIAQWEKDSHGV